MQMKLLAMAAFAALLTFPAAPAAARPGGATMIPDAKSAEVPGGQALIGCRDGDRHHMRRDGGFGCSAFGGSWVYDDGEWARYNNRSWNSDSYNDWWHDRPDRAYPRWVQEQRMQGTCEPDRMWWSGSGWHC